MPPALKLGLGLFAIVVLGVLTIHMGLPGPGARAIEARLESTARARLAERGQGWADVRAEGQRVVLDGTAPDEASVREAAYLAATTIGPGGPVAGAVTAVDRSAVEVAP